MKKSKYHSRKVIVDGIKFDSVKESRRYSELKLLEKAGKIKRLQRQIPFILIPAQYAEVNGKRKCIERECKYIADFTYYDTETGEAVVEDVKGHRTPEYIIKRKLMLYLKKIRIKEV